MNENNNTNNQAEKTFTQEDVNRIVSERLAQERKKYAGTDDPAAIQADRVELARYRANAARETMSKRMTTVMGGREFVNEYTMNGVLSDFQAALNDPANQGKKDDEIFSALTKDREGIFKSMHPPVRMGGFKGSQPPGVDPIAQAFQPKS